MLRAIRMFRKTGEPFDLPTLVLRSRLPRNGSKVFALGYKTFDVKSDAKILTERMIGIEQDLHYSSGEKKTGAVLTGVYCLHIHLRGDRTETWIWSSWAKRASCLPRSARKNVHLPADQLRLLADKADRYRSLVLLLGVGGLRWGEAAALRMIHAGANPKVVQQMLGYASAVMTLDVQRFVRQRPGPCRRKCGQPGRPAATDAGAPSRTRTDT